MVDIDCPLAAVGHELAYDFYGPILVPFPLTALRAWVLIPKCPAQEIGSTVAVHVERSDSLSVIVAELVNEIWNLWNTIRAVSPLLI
jgi:hypothetical protein